MPSDKSVRLSGVKMISVLPNSAHYVYSTYILGKDMDDVKAK